MNAPLSPYLAFVRRHRWSYLAALLVAVVGTGLYLGLAPTRFEASATTIVPYREVEADLRFGNGRPFPVQYTFVVNNHLEVLRSATVRAAILEALRREDPALLEELREERIEEGGSGEAALLRGLERRLHATSRDRTGVLKLSATASTAARAARLANLGMRVYAAVQDSLNRRSMQEWLAELEDEERTWDAELARREEQLQEFRSGQAVFDLLEESRALLREIVRLRGHAADVDAELAGEQARLDERREQLEQTLVRVRESLATDPASVAQALRAQIARDEATLRYLRATERGGRDHLVELAARIGRARQTLEEQAEILPGDPSLSGDPVGLSGELLRATRDIQPEIEGKRAEVERLLEEARTMQGRLQTLPALAATEQRMERELRLAEQVYELVQQRRAEAEILVESREARLPTVDPAEPPRRPSSPRRLLALASALLLTMLAGTGAGVVVEGFDPTVRDAEEAARLAGVPLVGRPRREGATVDATLAAATVLRGAGASRVHLVDVEDHPDAEMARRIEGRLAAAGAHVEVRVAGFDDLLAPGEPASVLLVAHVGRSRRGAVRDAARLLQGGRHRLLGVLVP
jgi:uncharacterized protein involved in exopolysaccharide biosynthesis